MPFFAGLYDAEENLFIVPGSIGKYLGNVQITPPAPPLAPTSFTPANSSAQTTTRPGLTAVLQAHPTGIGQHAVWQFAADSLFTTSVKLFEQSSIQNFYGAGTATDTLSFAQRLGIGTWYGRAAAVDSYGSQGPWTSTNTFTVSVPAPSTPTLNTPSDLATLTTGEPTVSADQAATSDGQLQKLVFQFCQLNTFTGGTLKTVTEADADLRASGTGTEVVPHASRLSQGTWYWRAKSVDEFGQVSSYTAARSFVVQHVPSAAGTNPASGDIVTFLLAGTAFQWIFSDPDSTDVQTAYQVKVFRSSDSSNLYDTGKIASASAAASVAVSSGYQDTSLYWQVRVWDGDDVVSAYSNPITFQLVSPPLVQITSPVTASPYPSGQPHVTWSIDAFTVQQSFRVVIRDSGNTIVGDSGTQTSTAQSWTFGPILSHQQDYTVAVTVNDNQGLSTTTTNPFTVFLIGLTTITPVITNNYSEEGYVRINWSAAVADNAFDSWHVFRRKNSGSWEEIYQSSTVTDRQYDDYLAEARNYYEYAVTERIYYNSQYLDSQPQGYTPVLLTSIYYWLIHPTDNTMTVKLYVTTADSYEGTQDVAEIKLLGRGRKLNYGTAYGATGTLSCSLRERGDGTTARTQKQNLETLRELNRWLYLRNPFGDTIQVALGVISYSRIAGVGLDELMDVQIPYSEVVG